MRPRSIPWPRWSRALAALACVTGTGLQAASLTPELAAALAQRAPQEPVAVILRLADPLDPRPFAVTDRRQRDTRLVRALRDKATATQGPLRTLLQNHGATRLRELWAVNGIAVTARAALVRQLAARPDIASIGLDATLQAPAPASGSTTAPEWNLQAVQAPALWSLGLTGSGVVVANMDTGVDASHPDLATRWRGGANSWYDPHGQHATPHDATGHGTQTMGILVGGTAGGTAIGLAPDARWIAAKLYDDAGQARYSDIHLAFQWLLDPDGNPDTVDAPDVVNASWGLVGSAGQCLTEFSADIALLRAAGIAVAFAAGNDGPTPLSSLSPANDAQGFAVGAVDATQTVAGFSSRGPSACDGAVYPKLAAPGVDIRSADLSFGGQPLYAVLSGTSYAAPHAAGALALLTGAFPAASVEQLEAALTQTARDLGASGADNSYGWGLADVQAAYQFLLAGTGSPPRLSSVPPTTATVGQAYAYPVSASDPDGGPLHFALLTAPAGMAMDPASGLIGWTPAADQAGLQAVSLQVTDPTGLFARQSYTISVSDANQPPLARDDSHSVPAGGRLAVGAPGVLANDSDPDGDPLTAALASGPAHGALSLAPDGGFSYQPASGYAGADSFSYRAFDGQATGNLATVSITVSAPNQPPVAADDAFQAPVRRSGSYAAQVLPVLANDRDPDGALAPASVRIVRQPSKGGSVSVNPDGTVSYLPRQKFSGKESFGYTVQDSLGASSATATVTVTVR